jgi:hypothetical protein
VKIIYVSQGGGGGTVQTDGVTITGDGSVAHPITLLDAETDGVTLQGAGISSSKLALKAVQTDASLTGAGIGSSTLGQLPITFWTNAPFNIGEFSANNANRVGVYGICLETPVTFSNLTIFVGTGDGANNYDLGFYTQAGALVAHVGAQTMAATGIVTLPVIGAPITLFPGLYALAVSGQANTLTIGYGNANWAWIKNSSFAASVGGALPASIGAISPSFDRSIPSFLLSF